LIKHPTNNVVLKFLEIKTKINKTQSKGIDGIAKFTKQCQQIFIDLFLFFSIILKSIENSSLTFQKYQQYSSKKFQRSL